MFWLSEWMNDWNNYYSYLYNPCAIKIFVWIPSLKDDFPFYFYYFGHGNQSVGNISLVNTRIKFKIFTFISAGISHRVSWLPQRFTATEHGILIRIVLICSDFISLFVFLSPFSLRFQATCSVFCQITGFTIGHTRKAKADKESFGKIEKSVPMSFLWVPVKH